MNNRVQLLCSWMDEQKIDALILHDSEDSRNSNITWLCGHPSDALLFVFRSGETVLLPWDVPMAKKTADCSSIIPFNNFNRQARQAIPEILKTHDFKKGKVVEISQTTPHPEFKSLQALIPETGILCREDGAENHLAELRQIKSEEEIEIYIAASSITNQLIDELEEGLRSNRFRTETDAALFIEKRSRELGAQGPGFDIIAAGPDRSFGIHAVPPFSDSDFLKNGLSLIDFGVRCQFYCTDVTIGITRGPLTGKQQEMASLTAETHKQCVSMCRPGADTEEICRHAISLFDEKGYSLDHALGHGIGLDVHEPPYLRNRDGVRLRPGMIITIEPGLYDIEQGGIRLENDILITPDGHQALTSSRMIHL
ncbi:MAG: aminopeptidase P family protein [Spirochaetales bacterium]|nr:aminopeptidase P family protein [Spirochaetales bacterium]